MDEYPVQTTFLQNFNEYLNQDAPGLARFKQTEKMDVKLLTTRPYENLRLSNDSKKIIQLEKNYNTFKSPMDGDPHRNLAGVQLKLYRTEKRLHSAGRRMHLKKSQMARAWADLEHKEKELRESFITFNQFCHENNEKRGRALKKLNEDSRLLDQRQAVIEQLQLEMREMKQVSESMEANVKNHAFFQTFLDGVVDASSDYNNINDIIYRFLTLVDEKKILSTKQKEHMLVLENGKNSMMKLIEEKNFVIMGLNNQIANLQARYENANIKALESEELVTQIKNNAVKQLGEIDTVKNSIWNVYVHMATSKKHPIKIKKENVEEQMMYINRTLTELNKVNKLIKKKSTKGKQ